MGTGSFLASVARYSLRPVRPSSKLGSAAAAEVDLIDYLAEAGPLSSFHLDLAARLQQLQLQGTENAHLNWLLDALACTLSTHSSLQLALTASPAASANHRADEVLSMLDVCSALKQVADDMDRHFGCLHHALQSVGQALNSANPLPSGRLRAAACRLSACLVQDHPHTDLLCILTGKQYRPLAEARASLHLAAKRELHSSSATPDLSQAIDGAMLTSLLVLASTVSSLAPPSHRKSSSSGTITSACRMIIRFLGTKSLSAPWAGPLRQLHRDLRREDMSPPAGGALFQELQSLHLAATKLHATITAPGDHPIELVVVKQSVENLRKSSREAQACIAVFRLQMASFFQALIALRLALLHS